MDSAPTAEIVPPSRALFDEARLAVGGFLARYSWQHPDRLRLRPAGVARLVRSSGPRGLRRRRPHVELYAPWMEEEKHLARATIGRRLSTVVGFYRYAVIDGYLADSPAEHVRRPKIDTESTTLGLDRMATS